MTENNSNHTCINIKMRNLYLQPKKSATILKNCLAMKNTILLLALVVSTCQVAHAKYYFGRRPYHISLHGMNPASIMNKYGGGLEIRNKNVSTLFNYAKYTGVYPGKQYFLENQFYLRTRKVHQYYIYTKFVFGETGYDGQKLGMFGKNDIQVPETVYYGAGMGFGKRLNYKFFFITVNAGLKYCAVGTELPEEDRNMYILFKYTGPGSYVDIKMQFGIQL